ncbi:intraflagellar transport protein 74 homolog [Hydractinia symbiolongicarpus]|uniref:intraflagellar transport protein 74 homolog n=1 Tax=Hydractinia symbiolongicarpus TaxID=13093 RepID=UPI00254AA012|nr:intraflagellar transport protein 74 homolog [Hydractinia symbiolongicarpus]
MTGRPPSGALRLGTGAHGGRMGTAAGGFGPPGTGMRPGTRGGGLGGGALNSMVQVSDRPVTRQGLGGIKTQSQGPQRQVQDKSYWLGMLRGKITELNSEINKMTKEITQFNQENASYVSYEKRAEALASEIKDLQGELADYNAIVDKLNTNAGFEDLEEDYQILKQQNEKESKAIDTLFAQKQDKDMQLKQLELELDQERRMTESLVADMPPNAREKYAMLKNRNIKLQQELEKKQQDLDNLNVKIDEMEEEISQSPVKQEAVTLHEKIHELEEKRISLVDEMKKKETPAEERERLLKQVKEDNQEIARMEHRVKEIQEKTEKLQDEINQLDMDLEEHHGERTAKFKELKKREEDMDEFLATFDKNKQEAEEKQRSLEAEIVQLLEKISRATIQTKHMPSGNELKQIQNDLDFKENEMNKSKETAHGLDGEHARLQSDLEKVQQLETKITDELNSLKEKIAKMQEELTTYNDLNSLKRGAEEKRSLLTQEKNELQETRSSMKGDVQQLSTDYEEKKSKLEQNETYVQLGNLERKWQHLEQNNFAIKDYIAQKSAESNFGGMKENVDTLLYQINQHLIQKLNGGR